MRISAVIALAIFSLLSAGCATVLQPPQQGEWSNFHDKSQQNTENVQHPGEGAEK
jgi:hypothetical protein